MCLSISCRWSENLQMVTVPVAGAPAFLRGMRALFLTDLHLRERVSDSALSRFLDVCAALKPDLLLLGGDYAEGVPQQRRMMEAIARLDAPLGRYGCLGNNDRELASAATRKRLTARRGIRLLVNETAKLSVGGGKLLVTGVDEPHTGCPRPSALPLGGPDTYRVLLSHYPVWPAVEPARMPEMMLSGHTHGGQFRLFGLTPYSLPRFERGSMPDGPALVMGTKRERGALLVVSAGVGFSRIHMRVGAPPQIHLLEF